MYAHACVHVCVCAVCMCACMCVGEQGVKYTIATCVHSYMYSLSVANYVFMWDFVHLCLS